jgi:signal transduction histidine kinase
MIENLKIALRRQKRLIIIFFLTILLPSLSLSIFGLRALRIEKFRLVKQIENEHRKAAEIIKAQVDFQFREIEGGLQEIAQSSSFLEENYPDLKNLLSDQLSRKKLIDQVFIVYKNKKPWFPFFEAASPGSFSLSAFPLGGLQLEKLKRAEEYEFRQKKYKEAISLYQELFSLLKDKNHKAQMLNNIARVWVKIRNYPQALKYYAEICDEYLASRSSAGLPLALIARLESVDCYRNLGDSQNSLKSSLNFYRDILYKTEDLNEDQFKTYSSLAEERVTKILSENKKDVAFKEYKKEFDQLKTLHQEKIEQGEIIREIRKDIIPDLQALLVQSKGSKLEPFPYSKTANGRNFLILSVGIPDKLGEGLLGILGITIKNEYLIEDVLGQAIKNIQFTENTKIIISSLSGQILFGKKDPSKDILTITEFFEDNFPPWRIELFQSQAESSGIIDIRKSFYFLTILTLILILTFGAFLIVRTIVHEMEILKIKSDFVSSVSHEFKTPLTSIKALTERLQEGKVQDPAKMKQYFSMISTDTDKLARLVKNILDFSRIEEGKKEYDFVETDISKLLAEQIENFKKNMIQEGLKIHLQIFKDIPPLYIDRDAFSQALNNILDNAIKFSPDKKEISITIKRDRERVIIGIQDRGMGISPDEIDKIFDKFYQGKTALRQSIKGAGLGLTLVKHTVEAHGGKIAVESQVGQGSTFSLIFPIKKKGE